ncbi:ATP synthase subunit b, mitochondrial [Lycorma delicatula]|uniref:ATP synthase subunit b, mitochondrial n=1 Tax=Lycorma delicatula TaxID=130591 RepID=UPI003F50DC57
MLSRIAFHTVKNVSFNKIIPSAVGAVRCTTSQPSAPSPHDTGEFTHYAKSGTRFPWEGPERDVVNFPRPVQPEYPGKTRFLFIPEEWFEFFYKKTGVTGPYVFGFGLYNYLMSKEIWIIEHEYYYVYATAILIYIANKKFGSKIGNFLDKELDKEAEEIKSIQGDEIKNYESLIEQEKKLQWQSEGQKLLLEAKKENIFIQQEAIYRERAMHVYNEVKKRLEFHAQKQLMERRVSQKHMVDWVVNEVLKSITPQQEKDTLKKCLVDLQALASRG